MSAGVTVAIVAYHDADDLPDALAAVGNQTWRPLELVVVDCASADGSAEVARRHAPGGVPIRVVELGVNAGFAGGMNAAFRAASAPYFLTLNADARLAPDYVERLGGRPGSRRPGGRPFGG